MADSFEDLFESVDDVQQKENSPWYWHENSETGALAIFPKTAKSESEWEARALLMHDQQVTIRLESKPLENQMALRKRLARGD